MRRVVVTGMGLVSPLRRRRRARLEASFLPARAPARASPSSRSTTCLQDRACQFRAATAADGTFNPEAVLEPKELRKIDDFILYGIAAADEALKDSGWEPKTDEERCATGVMIGSGIGGLEGIAENAIILQERGPRRISPFFIPGNIINLVSGPGLDPPRAEGSEPCGRHRLLDRRARHRRRGAADHLRRCRRDGGRRRRSADHAACRWPASPPAARCRPMQRHAARRPRAPTTATATASSWARAPASSCSKNSSTPRRAARRSMPKSTATA